MSGSSDGFSEAKNTVMPDERVYAGFRVTAAQNFIVETIKAVLSTPHGPARAPQAAGARLAQSAARGAVLAATRRRQQQTAKSVNLEPLLVPAVTARLPDISSIVSQQNRHLANVSHPQTGAHATPSSRVAKPAFSPASVELPQIRRLAGREYEPAVSHGASLARRAVIGAVRAATRAPKRQTGIERKSGQMPESGPIPVRVSQADVTFKTAQPDRVVGQQLADDTPPPTQTSPAASLARQTQVEQSKAGVPDLANAGRQRAHDWDQVDAPVEVWADRQQSLPDAPLEPPLDAPVEIPQEEPQPPPVKPLGDVETGREAFARPDPPQDQDHHVSQSTTAQSLPEPAVKEPAAQDHAATGEATSPLARRIAPSPQWVPSETTAPQTEPPTPPEDHSPSQTAIEHGVPASKLASRPVNSATRAVHGATDAQANTWTGNFSVPRPEARDGPVRSNERKQPDRSWRAISLTILRYAALAFAVWYAAMFLLIVLFRFIDPPVTPLMAWRAMTGEKISHQWVPISKISRNLQRSVVVSEDGRFCQHWGIDPAEIVAAIHRARNGTPRGASTITMQVAKNLFLWSSKSYLRKALEAPLAITVDLVWPKERILEVYLNIAEWGPGVFGAQAAARYHFNKSVRSLSQRQAALMAVALPNPIRRNAGKPGRGTSRLARIIQARAAIFGGFGCIPNSR